MSYLTTTTTSPRATPDTILLSHPAKKCGLSSRANHRSLLCHVDTVSGKAQREITTPFGLQHKDRIHARRFNEADQVTALFHYQGKENKENKNDTLREC